jgi:hypothetical protein
MPDSSVTSRAVRPSAAIVVVFSLLATLPYWRTLGGGFLGDDFAYIARFLSLGWSQWPALFFREWSDGLWGFPLKELRPFSAFSFMVDSRLWGGSPLGYRLTNLALYIACIIAVLRLCWHYLPRERGIGWLAALLFALQPAHAEAVSWITGRVDLLATAFTLTFWLLAESAAERYSVGRGIAAVGAFFIAVFSKELALMGPLLWVISWRLLPHRLNATGWRFRLGTLGGVLGVVAFYAYCRHLSFGADFNRSDGTWGDGAAWLRQVQYLLWMLPLFPQWLLPRTMTPSEILPWFGALLAVIILAAALWTIRRGTDRWRVVAFFGGIWYLVTVGSLLAVAYFSPRHLFFPTVGWCIALAVMLTGIPRVNLRRTAIPAVLVWWTATSWVSIAPWSQAGQLSQTIRGKLGDITATLPSDHVLLLSVPPARQGAWLWAWATPAVLQRPFQKSGATQATILERPDNYVRPERWALEHDVWTQLQSAAGAHVLVLDRQGAIHARSLSRQQLLNHLPQLRAAAGDHIHSDTWTWWLHELLATPP